MKSSGLIIILSIVACSKSDPAKTTGGGSSGSSGSSDLSASTGSAASVAAPDRKSPPTPENLALFDSACTAGNKDACYDSGMRRMGGLGAPKSAQDAVVWLEKGCNLDNLKACKVLASLIGLGQNGVTKDEVRAGKLHEKLCAAKDADECDTLAGYYYEGLGGMPKDLKKAMELLGSACKLGSTQACGRLDEFCSKGDTAACDAKK